MIPYACRGGIWNQGWANIGEGIVYYNNLHSMIRGWRLMLGQAGHAGVFQPVLLPMA